MRNTVYKSSGAGMNANAFTIFFADEVTSRENESRQRLIAIDLFNFSHFSNTRQMFETIEGGMPPANSSKPRVRLGPESRITNAAVRGADG
jgi:hypothetical protein